nr:hypothetical protein [Tanacetum cinerariifolium]
MKPFGCPVTILNTLDHLGKFDGKADEEFFVGYVMNSSGPDWLFDIDALTRTISYEPIAAGTESNGFAGTKACDNADQARKEKEHVKDYILLPLWAVDQPFSQDPKSSQDDGFQPLSDSEKKVDEDPSKGSECKNQEQDDNVNITNNVNAASTNRANDVNENINNELPFDPNMPALKDINPRWIEAMQEELLQFKLQEVWTLVDLPNGKRAIGTKWVFRNKKDERAIAIRNKARLMDVKSAFLYGKIEEEVYVCQPPRFEDSDFPDKVFHREKIEKTLFIRRHKDDILLVQVYVDDIIFGSTKKELCIAFEKMLHEKFQMSSMGELTFFLGLQVKQKQDGIFISQDKYITEILMKYGFTKVKNASTPMETQKPLLKDKGGKEVDVYMYRYLKGQTKFDLWYPKDSPFDLVAYTDSDYAEASLDRKSITGGCQFLWCRLISWQCKKQTVVANFTTETEYVVASSCYGQFWTTAKAKSINGEAQIPAKVDGKKVITRRDLQFANEGGVACLPNDTIFEQLALMGSMGEGLAIPTDPQHTLTILQPSTSQQQKTQKPRKSKRKDTQVPQLSGPIKSVADEAVYKEMDERLMRSATTASSLEAKQDNGGGPRCQEAMEDTVAQTRVLDLEKTKTTQALEIDSLKRKVKKHEKKQRSRTHKLKRLYKVGLSARVEYSDDNKDLGEEVFVQEDVAHKKVIDKFQKVVEDINTAKLIVDVAHVNAVGEVNAASIATTDSTAVTMTVDEATLAQALMEIKTSKPKAKGIVLQEPSESPTTTTTISSKKSQDKGKSIMVEEPVKPKTKYQVRLDEEVALKLQAEFNKE